MKDMIDVSSQPVLLNQLVEALNQAAGGASQLIHTMSDPRWMIIRDSIELTKEGVLEIATFAASKITTIRPA